MKLQEVELDGKAKSIYVNAENDRQVRTILKRMFRNDKTNFAWDEYEIVGETEEEPQSAVRGPDGPYVAYVPSAYEIVAYEKRVNQAGFKGVYTERWHR